MKNFIPMLLICGLIGFAGCALPPSATQRATASYGSAPTSYESKIKEVMALQLRDPTSPIYAFCLPRKGYFQGGLVNGSRNYFGWIVPFSVNAKNGFGGYAGAQNQLAFFTEGKVCILPPDSLIGYVD